MLVLPLAARANGDPASDVLPFKGNQVFLPIEAPVSGSAAAELRKTVSSATDKGYEIKVALIPYTGDLGTAVSLWKHPQDYAKFLGKEIAFSYTGRLLIAMPSGFGFYNQDRPVERERQVLAKMPHGSTPTALAESATKAVRALAASAGVQVSTSGGSATRDRLILGAAVVAFLLVLVFPAGLIRRRARGGGRSPSSEPR
jgi:hypothetical protein